MSVRIDVEYLGNLKTRAVHGPSGSALETVPPVDNQGDGSRFSPTDLAATSLGTCVLTTMGVVARRREIDMSGARVVVEKEMTMTGPRRIARLPVIVTMPPGIATEHRGALEAAGRGCPVHRSLHPDVDAPITFVWE
jgi:putative redox protein